MTKKTKIEITEKLRKKYGACEHDQVSYKELEKLNRALFLHCKRLSRDIDRKGAMMELWTKNRQTWTDKINKDLLAKAENHTKEVEEIKAYYEGELKEQKELYNECIDANKELSKVNRHCIKVNKSIIKDHNEITRAYNGLHSMGKFCEEQGIDIKRHNKMLPEDKDQFYDFKQDHKLLESGKVQHT
jgi:chromosome segregation ATPase